MKAARTNSDGYYLAWLVNQIPVGVQVDLIGYSFLCLNCDWSPTIVGRWRSVRPRAARACFACAPMQAILIAAAVNNNWLAMGRPHGQALVVVDQMLALNNGCDRAPKRYGKSSILAIIPER